MPQLIKGIDQTKEQKREADLPSHFIFKNQKKIKIA
jgi:hypothetical protein